MTWHTYDAIIHGLLILGALISVPTAFIFCCHEIVVDFQWRRQQSTIHHPASVRSYVVAIPQRRPYDWQQQEQPHGTQGNVGEPAT